MSVGAWRLDLGCGAIAQGAFEMVELLDQPRTHALPCGPRWCRELLDWRGRWVPLARFATTASGPVAVIAWQPAARQPLEYGALRLVAPPQRIDVADDADCGAPARAAWPVAWQLAWFAAAGEALVVLDLGAMFERRELVA